MGPPKGAVARFLSLLEPSWAWEWHFSGLVWVNLGASQLGWVYLGLSIKSLTGQFMLEKRHFWSRNVNYHRFFGLFLDFLGHALEILSWTLQKRGARSILVVGESLHVIESTSFSSPTGFPEPPRAPGDPPGDPQEGLEIICIFFNFWFGFELGSGNLLAVTPGRFAARGDGSPRLNVS